jgi:hypothetical protein
LAYNKKEMYRVFLHMVRLIKWFSFGIKWFFTVYGNEITKPDFCIQEQGVHQWEDWNVASNCCDTLDGPARWTFLGEPRLVQHS